MSRKHSTIYSDSLNTSLSVNGPTSNIVFADNTVASHLRIGDHVLDAETLGELLMLLDAVRMLDHDSPLRRALTAARAKRRILDGHAKTD